jgi:hypothetical protein
MTSRAFRHAEHRRLSHTPLYGQGMGCIFCGSEDNLSKEHLWSDWARKAIEADAELPVSTVPHVIKRSDGSNKQWEAPVFSATLNKVCRDCNSTWMSDVEDLTKDLVLPMLRNEQVLLEKEEQLCLAAWGYLKVLVHQRVDRQRSCRPIAIAPSTHISATESCRSLDQRLSSSPPIKDVP